jgi:spermidine synthase
MTFQARRPIQAICMAVVLVVFLGTCAAQDRLIHETRSQFNHITVRDGTDGVRRLFFDDGATQSAMRLNAPNDLYLPYARTIMCGLAVVPQPKRILIVGLGGGTMPTYLRSIYPDVHIDIAELDPAVADVAKRFFNFREDEKMKIHIGDGRRFIETTENKYDIIFLDAYGADSIPYSLATREFLLATRKQLAENGIVVGNIWSQASNRLYYAMTRTYLDVFEELHILRAPASQNRIFIALPRKAGLNRPKLIAAAREAQKQLKIDLDLGWLVDFGYSSAGPLPTGTKVLLDADAAAHAQ